MPLPRLIARVNRRVTNRLLGGLAQRLPGFGVVIHTGRRSRRVHPVNVFRRGDRYIIALTYGSNADWVRNVLANGGCTLETQGERFTSRGRGCSTTRVLTSCPRRSASSSA